MDDLLINPAVYDPFTAPVVLFILAGLWLLALPVMRWLAPKWSSRLLWSGAAVVLLASLETVVGHTVPELGELKDNSRLVIEEGSADLLRERDPVFALLNVYRQAASPYPLAVVDDRDGEAERWARYYVHPREVVSADVETLQQELAGDLDGPRYFLSRGAPALPADVQVSIEGRHEDWLLFQVTDR